MNATALRGAAAFASTEDAILRTPGLWVAEALFVFAPLALHAALGIWLVVARPPLDPPAPYPPAVRRALRATGLALLAFLVMHLLDLRFAGHGSRLDGGSLATLLASRLSSTSHGVPWRGLAYLAGMGCVAFHFAVGLWGFFAATAMGRASPTGRRRAAWASAVLGASLWLVLTNIVVFHATGGPIMGGEKSDAAPSEPCR